MGRLGDTTIDAVMDLLFGAQAYTPAASYDIALSTTQPANDGTGVTEPAGGGYARVQVTNDLTHWPAASGRQKSNGVAIAFPTATGDWGTIGWFAIYDHGTSTFRGWGALAVARHVTSTSAPATFDIGALVINGPGS